MAKTPWSINSAQDAAERIYDATNIIYDEPTVTYDGIIPSDVAPPLTPWTAVTP